jgi:hypothetical protein
VDATSADEGIALGPCEGPLCSHDVYCVLDVVFIPRLELLGTGTCNLNLCFATIRPHNFVALLPKLYRLFGPPDGGQTPPDVRVWDFVQRGGGSRCRSPVHDLPYW